MKFLIMSAALLAASAAPSVAGSWKSSLEDGIKVASVAYGEENEIQVMCDEGVNAPITSINFLVKGIAPIENSSVRLKFDKDEPIFAQVDAEGGLGSTTAQTAEVFRTVLAKLKTKGKVNVRLFDGSEHDFALRGSTKSIGNCTPDFDRYSFAQN